MTHGASADSSESRDTHAPAASTSDGTALSGLAAGDGPGRGEAGSATERGAAGVGGVLVHRVKECGIQDMSLCCRSCSRGAKRAVAASAS